ncbi:MAG: hypothetical protein COT71_00240 [Candidatus Andersenbacteria bacterium CG10_big_fil_rev_8_21_14_0_10_54_11]|uniref:Uncharacterized protein n=1 Tax=Candidatus Andersenbacteria bacterium CG10_big_fil_rev_8_21_14_0_10_54_11 TaxID=1974485 RepID=A0A2M6X0J1_9BACT|nr:MAG: hypothetical protein COT71_00240 [Candidatus Andersenbacteria bacterium CG10_big_fil_rev_8_21_14_0_10_54_11]
MRVQKEEINLLPQPLQQARVRRLYVSRLRQLVFTLAGAMVLVVSVYAVVWWRLTLRVQDAASASSGAVAAADGAVRLNAVLFQIVQQQEAGREWLPMLADVFAAAPSGVQLTAVSGHSTDNALTVAGVADERAAIIAFQQSLASLPWVDQLDAPLSNLSIGDVNDFTFVLRAATSL